LLLGRFGLTEHRIKGVPNDLPLGDAGRKHLTNVAAELAAGRADLEALLPAAGSAAATEVSCFSSSSAAANGEADGPPRSPATVVVHHLQDVLGALQDTAATKGLKVTAEAQAALYRKLGRLVARLSRAAALNPADNLKLMRHEAKQCIRGITRQQLSKDE
jgi:hypothetical protein